MANLGNNLCDIVDSNTGDDAGDGADIGNASEMSTSVGIVFTVVAGIAWVVLSIGSLFGIRPDPVKMESHPDDHVLRWTT